MQQQRDICYLQHRLGRAIHHSQHILLMHCHELWCMTFYLKMLTQVTVCETCTSNLNFLYH